MKRLLLALFLASIAFGQAVRVDPTPVFTVSSNVPPGAYAPVLAISGAIIAINTTTYTSASAATACPASAPVVLAGTAGCVATANAQGSFGFWVLSGSYLYTITLPNGQVFGPYPITPGGSGGGGGAVSSITGTPNQVIASSSTGAVTLSLPQNIAPGSTVTFNGVISTGAFNASCSGSAITFQTANTNFQVDCLGNISTAAQINLTGGGSSSFKVGGTVVIDGSRNATIQNLTVLGTCTGCASGSVGSITGTANQVIASSPTGAVTLSLPQSIGTSSAVTFGSVASAVFNATNTGASHTFQNANSKFIVDGDGNVTATGNQITTGYITSSTWFGLHRDTSTPGSSPGGGLSAFDYKGGTSGLEIWLYDVVHSAWTSVDLGVAGTGISSINGQTGTAQTIAGTTNQVVVTTTANTQTLSLPQNINTGASVTFANVTGTAGVTSVVFNSTATGATTGFQLNNLNFLLDGRGNITTACASGCTAGTTGANAIIGGYATVGTWIGLPVTAGSPATTPGGGYGAWTYKGGSQFWYYNSTTALWVTFDAATGGSGLTSLNGATGPAVTLAGTANQVSVTTVSNTITLSLPQNINTSAAVNFGSVSVTGVFQSTVAAGGGLGFQIANGLGNAFSVNGNGDISGQGGINMVGGSSLSGFVPYKVNGTTIVDASRNATFNTVTATGQVVSNATGASTTFANGNFNFIVNGNGAITTQGVVLSSGASGGFNASSCAVFNCIQASGGGGIYGRNLTALVYTNIGQSAGTPGPTTGDSLNNGALWWDTNSSKLTLKTSVAGIVGVINSGGAFVGNGVDVGANGVQAAGYNITGGQIGQNASVTFGGGIIIGGVTYSHLVFAGGVLVNYF